MNTFWKIVFEKKCECIFNWEKNASSLHHALQTLTPEEKEQYKDKTYTIPGLSLNPNTKNPRKIVQNLLSKDMKDERKNCILAWCFK